MSNKAVKNLTKATHECLMEAVDYGIKNEMPKGYKERLANDVFVFSGAKTYTQLKEASGLLLTEDGKGKSREQFKRDVLKVDETYNVTYLDAEYQFATTSAEVADLWKQWEENGADYDLQFRTAADDRVRPSHQLLHNITLPFDDPFWDYYITPLGWRCRCIVVQVRKGKYELSDSDTAMKAGDKATTVLDKDGKNVAAMFRYNPGKQAVIFPPNHPYRKVAENAQLNLTAA